MPEPVTPDRYDAETAAAMTTVAGQLEGLPTYLGIRTTHVGPAVMTAELDAVTAAIDRNPRPSIHNRSTSRTSNTGTSLNAMRTAFRVETRTAVS